MPTKISNSSKCQFHFQGPKLGEVTDERQSVISELAGQINFGIAILALLFFLTTILMPCCLRKPKRAVYVRMKEPDPEPAEQAARNRLSELHWNRPSELHRNRLSKLHRNRSSEQPWNHYQALWRRHSGLLGLQRRSQHRLQKRTSQSPTLSFPCMRHSLSQGKLKKKKIGGLLRPISCKRSLS